MYAGVESGGTKIVCAVSKDPEQLVARTSFPTGTDPQAAVIQIAEFFREQQENHGEIEAIGFGSFGPCDPNPSSSRFGYVTSTPKPGWQNFDVISALRDALKSKGLSGDVPIPFDTDVNAAALAEHRCGAGRAVDCFAYFTVGTGIGGGALESGRLLHGLIHPEMGHIRIPRPASEIEVFDGVCPYHGDCWEGVAAGPAIAARWGERGENLPAQHPAWDLEAAYLAAGLHAIVCTLSPGRIAVGGGVGLAPGLLERVRPLLLKSLANYVDSPVLLERIDEYLVPAATGADAGVIGAMLLAEQALSEK